MYFNIFRNRMYIAPYNYTFSVIKLLLVDTLRRNFIDFPNSFIKVRNNYTEKLHKNSHLQFFQNRLHGSIST